MSKLPRPHIPLEVRLMVAERQIIECQLNHRLTRTVSNRGRLKMMLDLLSWCHDNKKMELHHRPALVNREKVKIAGITIGYIPDANDHRYLVYLPEDEHDIETRVRGQGAQLSDLAQARKNKRIARARAKKTEWAPRKPRQIRRAK